MTETATRTKVTFRTHGGKAHRGLLTVDAGGKWLVAVCGCPGSNNGRLTKGAQVICEGWEKSNCRKEVR